MTAPTLAPRRVTPTGVQILPADAPRDLWLAERRRGIGSSDVAAIVGVADRSTAVRVWHDKLGHDVDDAGEAALWGTLLEEPVAQEWCRRNTSVIRRVGLVARQDAPWMRCTLDRRVLECPLADEREACALEVKCRSAFKASRWHRAVPDDVLAQVQWQMAVTGHDHVHVAVLIGGNDYRQVTVRRDQEVIDYLTAAADVFWHHNVAEKVEPEWDLGQADALAEMDERLHPDRAGNAQLDRDGLDAVYAYVQASAAASTAGKARTAAAARLRQLLDGRAGAVFGDQFAYELAPRSRSSVDLAQLAERFPDAYAACVSTTDYHAIQINPQLRAGVTE